jgi:hypothetical protein
MSSTQVNAFHAGKEEVQWPDYHQLLATKIEKQSERWKTPPNQEGHPEDREAASSPGEEETGGGDDEADSRTLTATGRQGPKSRGAGSHTGTTVTPAKTDPVKDSDGRPDNTSATLNLPAGPEPVATISAGAEAVKNTVAGVVDPRPGGDLTGPRQLINVVEPPTGAGDMGLRLSPTSAFSRKGDGQAKQKDLRPRSHRQEGEVDKKPAPTRPSLPPSSTLSHDPRNAQAGKGADVPAGSPDAHDASSVQTSPTRQEMAVERGTSGPAESISPSKAWEPSPTCTPPMVGDKGGPVGLRPDPSGADAGKGTATDEAGGHNSLPPLLIQEERGKKVAARSSMTPSVDLHVVKRQPKTDNEEPHASIREVWDVEEAELLLAYYLNHAHSQLQKPGAPWAMLKGFCWYRAFAGRLSTILVRTCWLGTRVQDQPLMFCCPGCDM